MKNFPSRIECIVEPEPCYYIPSAEPIRITMRCKVNGQEFALYEIRDFDFMKSYFDLIFDHMRDKLKLEIFKNEEESA